LEEELIPFDDGVLWDAAVELLPSSSSRVRGCAEFVFPSSDRACQLIWVKLKMKEVLVWSYSKTAVVQGVALRSWLSGDFPSTKGLAARQRLA
jgi:hypothetical protein